MLDHQKQKKVRKFLRFYLAVRKILCTFAEDLAALGNLRTGLSLRRRQIVAADTRRVEKSIGRLEAGSPYDKGKGQIIIGASPKLPSARSLFSNHSNP